MKKFDIKDVFSWSNAEDAKQYIGKVGYFADNVDDLQECVNNDNFQTLFSINLDPKIDVDSIFSITEMDYEYALFIPADKVIEVETEKKYRPFETIEEFVKTIGDIGTIITYREKKEPSQEMRGIFTGYMWDRACRGWILGLGATLYRLENLFELAEYKYKNEWQPFGVLENE